MKIRTFLVISTALAPIVATNASATTVGDSSALTTINGNGIVVNGNANLNNDLNVVGSTTLGNSNNATSILSTTVSIGNATGNTSVDIATGSGENGIVLGNTNAETTMLTRAGNSEITLYEGTAVMGIDPVNTGTSLSAATVIAQNGEKRIVADENGKLEVVTSADTTSGTTAAMVVTNSAGNMHGVVVQEDKTVVSGGTSSSSLTLADNGATFSNSATGRPIQVHGVADGIHRL